MNDDYDEDMKIDYFYPEPTDIELQYKLYKKREFYVHKTPERPHIESYNDIKEYRDNICARNFTLHEHQAMLGNFINPDTPYKGLIVFHGLGSGKCVFHDTKIKIRTRLNDKNNDKIFKAIDIWYNYYTYPTLDSEGGEWSKPLQDLYVESLNIETNKLEHKKIVNLYREYVNTHLRKIICENSHEIIITYEHKLYTQNGWSKNLQQGNYIYVKQNNNLEYVKIKSIENIEYKGYVYDFEVEDYHNYIANEIVCHNTCVGVSIAEKFKSMVQKYGTKITILVSGPLIKESWKHHILKCTGDTYLQYQDQSIVINNEEKIKQEKQALSHALQYYRFMSYKSFYKHVIGEKIIDKQTETGKAVYRKTDEGDFERDISIDRIYNLNNSLIVVDEAHNLTNNNYGEALKYIIKNSLNLKVVLLTATPMKNLGSDIIELLNFIRPLDSQIEKDKVFVGDKGHTLSFKNNGMDYLRNMMKGYISHVRGADPLTYAKKIEKGVKTKGLLFTKVTRCHMLSYQEKAYNKAIREAEDSLDRKSEAVSNFVFPSLSSDKKTLEWIYGNEGLDTVKNQLKSYSKLINEKLSKLLFGHTEESDLIYLSKDGKSITGRILQMPYLKLFSTKFYKALKKIERLVWSEKGASTAFIYSNLVRVGISLFNEILLQNGYLEYQENNDYQINSNTKCYLCGKTYIEHENLNQVNIKEIIKENIEDLDISDNSSIYEKTKTDVPFHKFRPATFITVTGKSTEEALDSLPEEKMNIIKNVFNNVNNVDGRDIKFVLGSKVMNEGISLYNVKEVHILDAYFNFGRIDQVIGRAIRYCSHYKLMSETNVYPEVNVYKYVIGIKNGLSTEEELYQKAEQKYLLIKKIERMMKEVAIDCPLNLNANIFKEEIETYKNCKTDFDKVRETDKEDVDLCPAICDYTKCNYICDDIRLNNEFYDPNRLIYKKISRDKLDYSTFTQGLARDEIENAKDKIKEMYLFKYIYTLKDIIKYVKESYSSEKRELFDDFFVFKALDELIPITENDFNNFNDVVIDKHNRQGYLIYVNKFYIFQPFDQKEDVPMYYRTTVSNKISNHLSLFNYLKDTEIYLQFQTDKKEKEEVQENAVYNFDDAMEYYDNRDEYDFVGFIDKELSRRKNKSIEELKDVFKIREKRAKILDKKRAVGIPTLSGSVCFSSKSKKYLENVSKKLNIDISKLETRQDICAAIKDKLLYLEKYSTKKDNNKFTYIMIPTNHPIYPFPYNLEDRVEHIKNQINKEIGMKINIEVKKEKLKPKQHEVYYIIIIKHDTKLNKYDEFLKSLNAKKDKVGWTIIVK